MDAREAVQQIQQNMASHASSGKASRLHGIIVSPEVYQALKEDSENFHGVIRVSSREGNRSIRYTFYVLENPNFPHQKSVAPYFFVSYPQEVYEERYLGREDEILSIEEKPRVEFKGGAVLTSINPVAGIATIDNWYLYNVDFEEVVAVARQAEEAEEPITETVRAHFDRMFLVHNPPETRWIKDEKTYDYHRTDIEASVGRLLMRKVKSDSPWRSHLYQVVGIGINGYGQIMELVMKESERHDPREFACVATRMFLPQEVADFLNHQGVDIPTEWITQIPVQEIWGTGYDPEDIGRLRCYGRLGEKEHYSISGDFIGTRAKDYKIDLVDVRGEWEWAKIKAEHFPPNWEGWSKTRHDQALEAFVQAL